MTLPYPVPSDIDQWAYDTEVVGNYPASDLQALIAWGEAEGGSFGNPDYGNVLGTTLPEPGSKGTNSANVQNYKADGKSDQDAWLEGLEAQNSELHQTNMAAIQAALVSGNATTELPAALNEDPWGTSGASVAKLEGEPSTAAGTPSGTAALNLIGAGGAAEALGVANSSAATTPSSTTDVNGIFGTLNSLLNPTGASILNPIGDISALVQGIFIRGAFTIGFLAITYLGVKTLSGSGGGSSTSVVQLYNDSQNREVRTQAIAVQRTNAETSAAKEGRLSAAAKVPVEAAEVAAV